MTSPTGAACCWRFCASIFNLCESPIFFRPPHHNMPEISDRGRSPLPNMNLIESLEASFGLLFALLGVGRNATPSEIIINKFRTDGFQSVTILNKLSGKVLTVEDSSTNQGARIQQVPRNCAASQRWLFKRTEFIKHRIIPPVVDREILRYCPTVYGFP